MKRRRFVVHPRLQLTLLFVSLVHVALVSAVLGAGLFGPAIIELFGSDVHSDSALAAANQILYMHLKFWPAVALALLGVALGSIWMSHRIAGPLYRFSRVLEQVGSGSVPRRTRIRKGDLLHKECDEINEALRIAHDHLCEIERNRSAVQQAIARVQLLRRSVTDDEAGRALDALIASAKSLCATSETFTAETQDGENGAKPSE